MSINLLKFTRRQWKLFKFQIRKKLPVRATKQRTRIRGSYNRFEQIKRKPEDDHNSKNIDVSRKRSETTGLGKDCSVIAAF